MVLLSIRLISDPPGYSVWILLPWKLSCFGDEYNAFNISPHPSLSLSAGFCLRGGPNRGNGHVGWIKKHRVVRYKFKWIKGNVMKLVYNLVYDTVHCVMCFVSWNTTYYVIEGFRMNICLTCYFVLPLPILWPGMKHALCPFTIVLYSVLLIYSGEI